MGNHTAKFVDINEEVRVYNYYCGDGHWVFEVIKENGKVMTSFKEINSSGDEKIIRYDKPAERGWWSESFGYEGNKVKVGAIYSGRIRIIQYTRNHFPKDFDRDIELQNLERDIDYFIDHMKNQSYRYTIDFNHNLITLSMKTLQRVNKHGVLALTPNISIWTMMNEYKSARDRLAVSMTFQSEYRDKNDAKINDVVYAQTSPAT